jgi:molybdenum cofactor cytidylyltransferase
VIPAVILAAGFGRRMGGPKALLELEGESLLQRTVRLARKAGFDPVLAVVGDWEAGPVAARLVPNPATSEGMASSIRAGITALAPEADRVLLLAVDQLAVDAALLGRIRARSADHPVRPIACAYADTVGIPAVFTRRLFPELLALRGDQGANTLLLREAPVLLPFPGGALDLDLPEDLAALRSGNKTACTRSLGCIVYLDGPRDLAL